jgi:hypothetical protein
MSATEIARLLAELRAGRLSADDVAERFRRREWPATRRRPPATYDAMAAQQDVDVDVPGSLDEVTAAYDRGELTSEVYRLLCDAVADAINSVPRQDC